MWQGKRSREARAWQYGKLVWHVALLELGMGPYDVSVVSGVIYGWQLRVASRAHQKAATLLPSTGSSSSNRTRSCVTHTGEKTEREWDGEKGRQAGGGIRSCHGIQITSTCTRVIRAGIPWQTRKYHVAEQRLQPWLMMNDWCMIYDSQTSPRAPDIKLPSSFLHLTEQEEPYKLPKLQQEELSKMR